VNTTSYIIFGITMFCVGLANILGKRMAQAVLGRSGKSHWPPAVNSELAREYRSLFGPNHTYTGYCFFNLATFFGLVVLAFYMALKG
jgi:hypothetical protein